MNFSGKTVLITGAGSGIGASAAKEFAAAGAHVVLADINADAVKAQAATLPGALAVTVDITDTAMLASMTREIAAECGGVDVLVNNAMHCSEPSFLDLSIEQIRRDIEVTLLGTMLCTRAVLPGMLERGAGAIVNLSSVNGLGYYGNTAYSAAKAGVMNFTQAIAVEFGGRGIRSNAVAPGTVATEYWEQRAAIDPEVLEKAAQWYPAGRVGTPGDIVSAIMYLASDQASWVNGHTLVVDGGLTAGAFKMAQEIVPEAE